MESEKSAATLFDLPGSVYIRIGRYLSWYDVVELRVCSHKCKEIGELMLTNSIRKIDLSNDMSRSKDDPNPYTAIRFCKNLRKLKLNNMNRLKDPMLSQFLTNNPNLEEVSIRFMRNTHSAGIFPLKKCKSLTKLTLVNGPIDDSFLRALSRHNIHLVEVELTHLKITVRAARDFFRGQPMLEKITLALRYDDIRPCLSTIRTHCPRVRSLDIHNAHISDHDQEAIVRFAKKCPTLKEICLRYNDIYEFTHSHPVVRELERRNIEVELHEDDDSDISDFISTSSDSEYLREDDD